MTPDHAFDDYRGKRVLVMGLGSFGGGLGAVQFLVARGARVTVTDLRPEEKLVESLSALSEMPPERLVLGHHDEADFRQADLVVANPAVKRTCPFLNASIDAGVPVTSEMNLFWKWNPAPVIAITGSNGKSTTTAMTHGIVNRLVQRLNDRSRLCASPTGASARPERPGHPLTSEIARGHLGGRRAWLGGNIGTSLLPLVDQIHANDLVVLELSSFQLADLERLKASPHVAVVTNFAPNHLDWHPNLDHYRESKQAILRWQTPCDIAVLNGDDPDVRGWPTAGERLGFGLQDSGTLGAFFDQGEAVVRLQTGEQRLPLMDWLELPGQHNIANALAAIAASMSVGAEAVDIQSAISNYEPLPHRLQFVGEVAGRRFYNDSLATTPESTEVALAAFDAPIVLLAGGYDKHVDLSAMAGAIALRAKAVSLMGQTAPVLRDLIMACGPTNCEVSQAQSSFGSAFEWAWEHSAIGDVVLLSPGCASYDWFRNFSDRGLQFMELVRNRETQFLV